MSASQELTSLRRRCKNQELEIAELKEGLDTHRIEMSADAEVLEEVRQALQTPKDADIVEHAKQVFLRAERRS